jgi:hypothetical protein
MFFKIIIIIDAYALGWVNFRRKIDFEGEYPWNVFIFM